MDFHYRGIHHHQKFRKKILMIFMMNQRQLNGQNSFRRRRHTRHHQKTHYKVYLLVEELNKYKRQPWINYPSAQSACVYISEAYRGFKTFF
jgi:hypothetical protein